MLRYKPYNSKPSSPISQGLETLGSHPGFTIGNTITVVQPGSYEVVGELPLYDDDTVGVGAGGITSQSGHAQQYRLVDFGIRGLKAVECRCPECGTEVRTHVEKKPLGMFFFVWIGVH